jgi:antitoxin VapB
MSTWTEFFEFMRGVDVPDEYMADRPLNVISEPRRLFDDE